MEHGGDIETYRGANRGPLIDFSSNISPLGVPCLILEKIQEAIKEIDRYPDIHYRRLRRIIAEYHGVGADEIVVGNGAMEIIALAISLFQKVYIAEPCFNEYAKIAKDLDINLQTFTMAEPFVLDVDAFISNMPEKALVILTNPNNPTGYCLSNQALEKIYRGVLEKDGYLLLDETFLAFVTGRKGKRADFKRERQIVVRAATKSLALAGLRLGWGIVHEPIRSKILKRQLPWSVNTLAAAAGEAIGEVGEYLDEVKDIVKKEREAFFKFFKGSTIAVAYPSEANFILIKLKNVKAEICFRQLLTRGILVRTYSDDILGNHYMRIAVRSREDNVAFMRAWEDVERSLHHV